MTRSVPPPRLPTPGSHRGHNAGTRGNLPAIARHAGIEAGLLYLAMAGGWRAGVGLILWGTEPPRCDSNPVVAPDDLGMITPEEIVNRCTSWLPTGER